MKPYDKSIIRLLDSCKKMLSGNDDRSILLIYSEKKNELCRLCDILIESSKQGYYVSSKEISLMLLEALQEEDEQDTIHESKMAPLLFLMDFEMIAGRKYSQNIIYEILLQRYKKEMKTVIFSTKDVFENDAFLNKMQILLEIADKFII